ncbi:MAG: hypothetical protein ACUZ8E_07235 [Candidatus Anammoxibacter sp.]
MDLVLHETGNGGDLQLKGNDLDVSSSIFNQIYMALFGGNPAASTTGEELVTEQRQDWWANSLVYQDLPDLQQNSTLEQVLNEVALNSSGRLQIEEAAKNDLKVLKDVAEISVETRITDIDRIEIIIFAKEPDNEQKQEFIFIWDATKQEVIEFEII